jgi:hypothetical protein
MRLQRGEQYIEIFNIALLSFGGWEVGIALCNYVWHIAKKLIMEIVARPLL